MQQHPFPPFADVDYNTLLHEMSDRVGVYHLILDATLTPSLDNASMPPARFVQAAWSPPGLLHVGRCLLASLTNYGSARVEYACNRSWRLVIDVSERWADVCRLGWEQSRPLSQEQQYEELCRREAQLRIVGTYRAIEVSLGEETYAVCTVKIEGK